MEVLHPLLVVQSVFVPFVEEVIILLTLAIGSMVFL